MYDISLVLKSKIRAKNQMLFFFFWIDNLVSLQFQNGWRPGCPSWIPNEAKASENKTEEFQIKNSLLEENVKCTRDFNKL